MNYSDAEYGSALFTSYSGPASVMSGKEETGDPSFGVASELPRGVQNCSYSNAAGFIQELFQPFAAAYGRDEWQSDNFAEEIARDGEQILLVR